MHIEKVAFTGSTAVGRSIMKAAAASNLKNVTLELGGKSPSIIFDDADIDQAVKWAAHGILSADTFIRETCTHTLSSFNHGQCCCAGSRVYVQAGIYKKFIEAFVAHTKGLKIGDPFDPLTYQGPQVSQTQCDRIMGKSYFTTLPVQVLTLNK
jgi:aldehyde dehydrogenase (NAD+)